ncbi:MAG: TrkH family potassium uptake protein [Planctomycetota bacterium]
MRPPVLITLGFLGAALLGALLLRLPAATPPGAPSLTFAQSCFTATSAVCVTGLTVVDTARSLSFFGQLVVLILIQLGGLGVMTLAFLVFQGLRNAMAQEASEVLSGTLTEGVFRGGLKRSWILVFGGTLLVEGAGAVSLWISLAGQDDRLWKAVFLSISGFCNAGLDVLPGGLGPLAGNPPFAGTLLGLWLIGGLGFLVPASVLTFLRRRGRLPLDLNARMILTASAVLIPLGALLFWVSEAFGGLLEGRNAGEQALLSLFQGNTCRTAGFSLLDLGQARRITLGLLIPLMLIGGAPGGTAGGAKMTSVWIFFATIWTRIKGLETVRIGRRRIPREVIRRSVIICVLIFLIHGLVTLLLTALEDPAGFRFEALAFEAASALGTVGLSTGITARLGEASQIVLILTMLVGRLGPITVVHTLVRRPAEKPISYPPAEVHVG